MSLHEAVRQMARAATDQRVGLVVRFNRSDSFVRTLWSEPASTPCNPSNPGSAARPAVVLRWNNDSDERQGTRQAASSNDVAGYHAEEIFVMCWEWLLTQAQFAGIQAVSHVDLVLSKSPCNGPGGSSPITFRVRTGIWRGYERGCARKLHDFIEEIAGGITWNIFYLNMAGSREEGLPDPPQLSGIFRNMTKADWHMHNARTALVTYRDTAMPGQQQEAQKWRRLAAYARQNAEAAKRRMSGPLGPNQNKGVIARRLQELIKEGQQADRKAAAIEASIANTMRTLEQNARVGLLGLGQAGLVLLAALPNVTVERWPNAG